MKSLSIQKSSNAQLAREFRQKYLESLGQFQELFLELIGRAGTFYFLKANDSILGYVIIDNDNTHIVEFYSPCKDVFTNSTILRGVCGELKVSKVYCKTFDSILVNAVNLISTSFLVNGILFRELVRPLPPVKLFPDISEKVAQESDLARIQAINDGFFVSLAEIETYIKTHAIVLFEDQGKNLVGCGLYQPIAYDYDYFDIGMLVNPNSRRKGYGTYIIRRLMTLCEEMGKIPICGCAYDNVGSYKTLSKAGFIPGYQILEYIIH